MISQEMSANDALPVPPCPLCGEDLVWVPCQAPGCEEGFYDAGEYDDPLLYGAGELLLCGDCEGQGGAWYCPHASDHAALPAQRPGPPC